METTKLSGQTTHWHDKTLQCCLVVLIWIWPMCMIWLIQISLVWVQNNYKHKYVSTLYHVWLPRLFVESKLTNTLYVFPSRNGISPRGKWRDTKVRWKSRIICSGRKGTGWLPISVMEMLLRLMASSSLWKVRLRWLARDRNCIRQLPRNLGGVSLDGLLSS